jgi:hypothetical protein
VYRVELRIADTWNPKNNPTRNVMMTRQSLKRAGLGLWVAGMIALGLVWHFDPAALDAAAAGIRGTSQ